jgi:hypothetical protein
MTTERTGGAERAAVHMAPGTWRGVVTAAERAQYNATGTVRLTERVRRAIGTAKQPNSRERYAFTPELEDVTASAVPDPAQQYEANLLAKTVRALPAAAAAQPCRECLKPAGRRATFVCRLDPTAPEGVLAQAFCPACAAKIPRLPLAAMSEVPPALQYQRVGPFDADAVAQIATLVSTGATDPAIAAELAEQGVYATSRQVKSVRENLTRRRHEESKRLRRESRAAREAATRGQEAHPPAAA